MGGAFANEEITMKTLSGKTIKPQQSKPFHPYETTLSRDALLAELDDRTFEWGEYQEIEAMLHQKPSQHGVLIAY